MDSDYGFTMWTVIVSYDTMMSSIPSPYGDGQCLWATWVFYMDSDCKL